MKLKRHYLQLLAAWFVVSLAPTTVTLQSSNVPSKKLMMKTKVNPHSFNNTPSGLFYLALEWHGLLNYTLTIHLLYIIVFMGYKLIIIG
jgi:hypothetical protein